MLHITYWIPVWHLTVNSEILKAPIKISQCGHSFCNGCLSAFTRGANSWECPKCRRMNNCKVESLARNYDLEQVVESLANMAVQPNPNAELGFCDRHQMPAKLRKSLLTTIFHLLINFSPCKTDYFLDCLVHGNSLCYECHHDHQCGGTTKDGCQTIKKDELERLIKVGI